MTTDPQRVLEAAFPGENARYFASMSIGHTPETADEGAALILDGIKTTIPFHRLALRDARFRAGDLDTHFVEKLLEERAKNAAGAPVPAR